MPLAENLHLPIADNYLGNNPGSKVAPKLVLINLEELRRQRAAAELEPEDYLAPGELATFRQFKFPKRQIEWLGGRLAAKQAFLALRGQPHTLEDLRQCQIRADEYGKPFFQASGENRPGLSISHSHGLAMAMAVTARTCGLDLQKISPATSRVKEKFCSPAEEQIIGALELPPPNNDQAAGLTLLWAAKEALRKARGGHPLTGFTAMHLTEASRPHNDCWLFTLRINDEKHLLPTFFYRDFAIALSVI